MHEVGETGRTEKRLDLSRREGEWDRRGARRQIRKEMAVGVAEAVTSSNDPGMTACI